MAPPSSWKARGPSATMPRLSPVQHWLSLLLPCLWVLSLPSCPWSVQFLGVRAPRLLAAFILTCFSSRLPADTQETPSSSSGGFLHLQRLPKPSVSAPLPTPSLTPAPGPTAQAHCPSLTQQSAEVNIQDVSGCPALGPSTDLLPQGRPLQSVLHQEVDEGRSGGQESLLDASPLQEPDTQLALEDELMDFVLVPCDALGHRDLAMVFVVDLRRRKSRQTVRSIRGVTGGPQEDAAPASPED